MRIKIILIMALFLLTSSTMKTETKIVSNVVENQIEITYKLLYDQIINLGIKFPKVVLAQAILETGHFKSVLFTNHNNLFGMKLPAKRETVATGKVKNGYATYSSWEDSVIDYFLWQNYMLRTKKDLTEKEYLAFIGKIYATDPRYLTKVKEKMKLYGHLVE